MKGIAPRGRDLNTRKEFFAVATFIGDGCMGVVDYRKEFVYPNKELLLSVRNLEDLFFYYVFIISVAVFIIVYRSLVNTGRFKCKYSIVCV